MTYSIRQSFNEIITALKELIEPFSENPNWKEKTEEALETINQSLKLLIEREANKNTETVQGIIKKTTSKALSSKFVSNQVKHFEDTQDLLEYAPHFITDKIDAVTEDATDKIDDFADMLLNEDEGLLAPFIPGVEDAMKFANFVLKHHNKNGHEVALSVYEILQSFITADESCFESNTIGEVDLEGVFNDKADFRKFGFAFDRIQDLGVMIIGAVSEDWEFIDDSSLE